MHNVYVHWTVFPPRPSTVGHIVQPHNCHIIEHIFVPTRSVEANIEKIWFPWVSSSKFMIFPQIYPRSNSKIFPNVPLLFPVSNGDSPVATTFPRSNYRGFLTTGESYCPMYTLCSAVFPYFNLRDWISIWKSDSVFPIQFKDESEVMSGKFTIEVTEQWLYVNPVCGLSASRILW